MGGSHLVVALGAGGTVSGAGRYINERNADVVIEQAKTLLAAIVGIRSSSPRLPGGQRNGPASGKSSPSIA